MIVFDFTGLRAACGSACGRSSSGYLGRPAGRRGPAIGMRDGKFAPAGTSDVGDASRLRRARAAGAGVSSPASAIAGCHDVRTAKVGAIGSGSFCARDGDRAAPHGYPGGLRAPGRPAGCRAAGHGAREPDLGSGSAIAAGVGPGPAAGQAEPLYRVALPRGQRTADGLQHLSGQDQPWRIPADRT